MASIVAKRKGNRTYYYAVVSGRVNGRPRITSQVYLGTAEKIADLVKHASAPIPISASSIDFGLPGALWLASNQSGVFQALLSLWPARGSAPSVAHYLLLAAFHRICSPGPKTEVAQWYSGSILQRLWNIPADRFTSQAFWDTFDKICPEGSQCDDQIEQVQSRLLGLWRSKGLISQRLLAYDTTNFYTYIASTNTRNSLAQRGRNKQGRHNLRQVGLSYVLDGDSGIGVCHHVYPGNITDVVEFTPAMERILRLIDNNRIPRDSVTIVFDKGTAALDNTMQMEEARVGFVSALPWNQAPDELRSIDVEKMSSCGGEGVRQASAVIEVHGKQYLCVVKYSASYANDQLHSITASLSKAMQQMSRLAKRLRADDCRLKEEDVKKKAEKIVSGQFMSQLVRWRVEQAGRGIKLSYDIDNEALEELISHRLGRTTLITSRMDWTAEQVIAAYRGQQKVEWAFRGLKDGGVVGWGPMHHWTDSKIKVHALYCMLGLSLVEYLHRQAVKVWDGLSVEQMLTELGDIKQFLLLYPRQGEKGPGRLATVISKQNLVQQALFKGLGLDQLAKSEG